MRKLEGGGGGKEYVLKGDQSGCYLGNPRAVRNRNVNTEPDSGL